MPQYTLDPALARALSEVIAGECGQLRTLIEAQRTTIETLTARVAELEGKQAVDLTPLSSMVEANLDALNERLVRVENTAPPAPTDLTPLTERVAALEAKPEPDLDTIMQVFTVRLGELSEATKLQIAAIPPQVDFGPLTEKVAALEARPTSEEVIALVNAGIQCSSVFPLIEKQGQEIEERFAALPPPPDLAPLTERVAALEAKPPPDLDAHTEKVERLITAVSQNLKFELGELSAATTLQIEALPPPVDLQPLNEKIAALEARPVFDDIKRTEIHGELSLALSQSLERKLAALPPPAKGDKGDAGKSVTLDEVRGLIEENVARWQLDFDKRAWEEVRRVLDSIPLPKDGIDGKDGFGFDDMQVTYDGARRIAFTFAREDEVKEFVIEPPWPLDAKQYKRGQAYKKGDGVTFGGSWFIAQRDVKVDEVPEESDAWRLAVKCGRNGKNGIGTKGDKGDKGDRGRDLTQLDYTTGRRF